MSASTPSESDPQRASMQSGALGCGHSRTCLRRVDVIIRPGSPSADDLAVPARAFAQAAAGLGAGAQRNRVYLVSDYVNATARRRG